MENRDKLKARINEFVNVVIDELADKKRLDHFDMEIKVHQKDIDLRCTIKDRGKVY